ncbi:MAG: HNH endonuclease [bacterium]
MWRTYNRVYRATDRAATARYQELLQDALSGIRSDHRLASRAQRRRILERDNWTCQLCGVYRADGRELDIDHREPYSLGGKTDDENLQTLCATCNRRKGGRLLT